VPSFTSLYFFKGLSWPVNCGALPGKFMAAGTPRAGPGICCCAGETTTGGGTTWTAGLNNGFVGVAPLSLSSLASWHKAQVKQKQCTQQSPHGCALRLYAFLTDILELYDRHEAAQLQK